MMQRFLMEVKVLAADEAADANFLSPRYDYIHQVSEDALIPHHRIRIQNFQA
jgi:hypothetical protein